MARTKPTSKALNKPVRVTNGGRQLEVTVTRGRFCDLPPEILTAIKAHEAHEEGRVVVQKWRADHESIHNTKDLPEFVQAVQPMTVFWAAHQREPYAEVAENLALTVQSQSETHRQQWMQEHPDAKINPMPGRWVEMRPWLFEAEREIQQTRIYTITIDRNKTNVAAVVRLLQQIAADEQRIGVRCKQRTFRSIKVWLDTNGYGDLWQHFHYDKERGTVTASIRPHMFIVGRKKTT